MNRIQDSINTLETKIAGMNGVGLTGQPLDEFEKSLDLAFDEFMAFQNAQSMAFASGQINFDEAQTLYHGLGGEIYQGGDGWPEMTSLARKATITNSCVELMGIR